MEARDQEDSFKLQRIKHAQEIVEKTDSKIKNGLSRPTASTGTPMKDLNGGAKFMAQLSNIGGGSLATGGGGIRDGFNIIAENLSAKIHINEALCIENKQQPPLLQDDESSHQ